MPRPLPKTVHASAASIFGRIGPAVLLLAVALLLSACSQTRLPRLRTDVELYPAPYFDDRTGIYFPGNIAGLRRQPIVNLEDKRPGLGIAVAYRNSHSKMDVFVYDLQASLIAQGVDSPLIHSNFDEAIADVRAAAAKGLYASLQLLDEGPAVLDGQSFLYARFTYSERLLAKESRLYVAGVNGQILKIRLTVALPSQLNDAAALAQITQAIRQSHRSGYGGITYQDFLGIEAALEAVDLSDGLQEAEAVALAQRALIDARGHTRFDPSRPVAQKASDGLTFHVSFPPYGDTRQRQASRSMEFEIASDGRASSRSSPR